MIVASQTPRVRGVSLEFVIFREFETTCNIICSRPSEPKMGFNDLKQLDNISVEQYLKQILKFAWSIQPKTLFYMAPEYHIHTLHI